jgi:D-alanyl-D-alanine carboxypeptidase
MTSGIQDYLSQPAFLRAYAARPDTVFSASRLVSYVVGLPLRKGWNYSNTNYVLAQMIIERATHDTYAHQLRRRIVTRLGLRNLFFTLSSYRRAVSVRLPAGYYFDASVPQLAALLGKDQRLRNVSYAQGAGGIVSSLPDLTKWYRALYQGRMLARTQQHQLESLVSQRTGKPIARTTPSDPLGFGLGVGQATTNAGMLWFYEGETLGYRVLHVYVPGSGILIALGANSATSKDRLGTLAGAVYQILHTMGAG